ncbi:MAG TPA: DUF4301 family protein [Syntrophobacteraceae bacterium]|nr:DUF4301 family protein [Syntrophobacteraceae bacterium]
MGGDAFSKADLKQMERQGITPAQVRDQLAICRSASFSRLVRPCTLGDGIRLLSAEERERAVERQRIAAQAGRFQKFVPASGAATRMFQSLLQIFHMPHFLEREELQCRVRQGVSVACDFLAFLDGLPRFAFYEDLEKAVVREGTTLAALIQGSQFRSLLEFLLTPRGLAYGSLPKGLLKFHRYPTESRTAFEEHLVEAARYIRDARGSCRLHFTISPEHEEWFRFLHEKAQSVHGVPEGVRYEVGFSFQKRSTDTIAVDRNKRPFRDRSGRLVFRPGGHGALLENLRDLEGDLIYIKNIDNVVPDRLKEPGIFWKMVLGGYLVEVQERVHEWVGGLQQDPSADFIRSAARFAAEDLLLDLSPAFDKLSAGEQRDRLIEVLDRPIRVCGVVRNVGEPGGAPFWVKGSDGRLSIQIVEKAQVNLEDPDQRRTWESSTHFNPVDVVCAVRDFEGRPYDLRKYVDPRAVILTRKSKDGRELEALELPGLWNGAMAGWITLLVEVPRITFNPVKTLFDLLKPEHSSEPGPSAQ